MNAITFEQLVVDVLDSLPPMFASCLENVEVMVEPRLTPEVRRRFGFERHEVVYGFYEGVPLTERSSDMLYEPALITLFREPFERDFPDLERMREEVRITVLHELAHHLGISDERLHALGAY